MPNLTDLSTIRDVCARHDFALSKGFGQNFIINPGICPRIAEAAGIGPGWGALEVGPGIGVLTEQLCKRADKVVSIEVDKRLPPILAETMAEYENFKLVLEDVLKVDLRTLLAEEFGDKPVAVCANLPYYITSPIVMKLLGDRLPIQNLTVMVQKEAADRLAAARRLSDLLAVQRGILDNISDSVVIFSPNLKLKSYNVAFLRLWGLGAAELDASPYLRELLDLLKPKLPELEDWNTFREDMLKHITSCTPFTLKLRSKQRIMVTPVILADTSLMITYHKE